jgi:hypothetical protein
VQQCAECIGENTLTLCGFNLNANNGDAFVGCNHNADVPKQHENKKGCNSIVVALILSYAKCQCNLMETLSRHFFDPHFSDTTFVL